MMTDLKILLQAYSTANMQLDFVENATITQMPSNNVLRFIANHNTCFKITLVF